MDPRVLKVVAPIVTALSLVGFGAVRSACDRNERAIENAPADDADAADTLEQVKLLYDYTKFHITVYTTLATILVAASSSSQVRQLALGEPWLESAVVAIIGAGLAAGVVAASMPSCTSKPNFWDHKTGPYDWQTMTIRSWTYVEHTSFWVAVGCLVIAFITRDPAAVAATHP